MEQLLKNYYGKNYEKAMENSKRKRAEMRANFLKRYTNADLSKFQFEVDLKKDSSIESTSIYFKNNEYLSTDITSNTFLNNKTMTKYLYSNVKAIFPKLWDIGGTIQELPRSRRHVDFTGKGYYWDEFPITYILNYRVNIFCLYVNGKDYFMSSLPELNITIGKIARPTEDSRFDT